jgi:hypothetical protein
VLILNYKHVRTAGLTVWSIDVMLLSANDRAVSLSQLGTRDLNFKASKKFCKIILLISEILLLFLLFNSPEAKYYHNNANCIDFSKRVNYYYESIMAHFADKYCSEDSKFLRTQRS